MLKQKKQDLKDLNALAKSRGWKLLVKIMEDEILASARNLGAVHVMPEAEMHFRRGAIFSADRLTQLPATLIAQLTNDVVFEEAIEQNDPAKELTDG